MKSFVRLALVLGIIGTLPAVAAAQGLGGINLSIGAGAAIPTSDFGQNADIGYNLTVGVGAKPATSPLGFRVEGFYNEFGITDTDLKAHAGGVSLNATYDISLNTLSSPAAGVGNSLYLIGGLGYYSTKVNTFFNDNSDTNLGYNVGAGFRFPLTGFSAYIEARYNSVSNVDMKFVPIVFGLVF
jgi:opacity protein-like surface antigen